MLFSLDNSLGFVTNRTANRLKLALERSFAEQGFNITAEQWSVLSRLSEENGLSQQEIVKRLSKDKTNIARILALMERNHLIERRVDTYDNRVRKTYLTPFGKSIYSDLVSITQETLSRALTGLSDDEVRQVISLLNTVFNNLA